MYVLDQKDAELLAAIKLHKPIPKGTKSRAHYNRLTKLRRRGLIENRGTRRYSDWHLTKAGEAIFTPIKKGLTSRRNQRV